MSKRLPSDINPSKPGSKRLSVIAAVLTGVVFTVSCALNVAGVFLRTNRLVYDANLSLLLRSRPPELNTRILPIDLNDRAERNLGSRIDDRSAFTDLFTVLGAGALSCAMDFLFSGTKDSAQDLRMAQAARQMDSLVLAVVPISYDVSNFSGEGLSSGEAQLLRKQLWHPEIRSAGTIPQAVSFLLPNPALTEAASFLGHVGVENDSDGVYRKTPLFFRWEDGYVPSLALALAAAELGIDTDRVIIDAGKTVSLPLKDGRTVSVPVDDRGYALIPYASFWRDSWPSIPLDIVSDAAHDEALTDALLDELYGSSIIVSDITTASKDIGIAPFEPVYPLSGIHSSLYNAILNDRFFTALPFYWYALFSAAVFVCSVLLAAGSSSGRFHAGSALLFFITALVTETLWFGGRIVFEPVCLLSAIFFSWLAGFILRLLQSRERKLLMQNALSRYFPRALSERIFAENKTDLKPAEKELTILFADIAGFTKWSSDKSAESVHAFLSDYLESMARIIFEYGGTVDKFMGDGILAFFGDPFDMPDHATRCCTAALAMQRTISELAEKWYPINGIRLAVRIGINTGNVIVGNLGSHTRIEYTVIGADVNLGQRMESNAPAGKILVCHKTREKLPDRFVFSEQMEITAKGYDVPVKAFVLESAEL